MLQILQILRLPLYVVGLALVFTAERYLFTGTWHDICMWTGLAFAGLGFVCAIGLTAMAEEPENKSWRAAVLWQALGLVSVALYFVYGATVGERGVPESFLEKALLAAWPICATLAFFAACGVEWALVESGRGPLAEPNRVFRSGRAWMAIGMLVVGLFAANYAATVKDFARDLSYLKTATPSDTTKNLLKGLAEELEIVTFFPRGNDVRMAVEEYFRPLAGSDTKVVLKSFDVDMHPTQAETYRVAANGTVVLAHGKRRARINVGLEMTKAGKTLRNLDNEFQKAVYEATSKRQIIYFTRGHGEMSWVGANARNQLRSLKALEQFLRTQNYSPRLFGVSEGSATAVPDDAAAVVVAGPTRPFQEVEAKVLEDYVLAGGKLLVFLDPEKPQNDETVIPEGDGRPLIEMLKRSGLEYHDEYLANERNFVALMRNEADRWFIDPNVFTSHESVTTLARNEERVAMFVFRGGYLTTTPEVGRWKTFETVRARASTFADLNKNFKFDQGTEKKQSYVLGAVAEMKVPLEGSGEENPDGDAKGRIVMFSDASLLSDGLIRVPANAVYFANSLKWAAGQADLIGEVSTEEDIKVRHSRDEDIILFWGTIVFMPLTLIGAGFIATRRKRKTGGRKES